MRERLEKAMACYDKALELSPDHETAWINKGRALRQMGKISKASECFRQAVKIRPESGIAWENLVLLEGIRIKEPEAERMQEILRNMDPSGEDAKAMHFALAATRWQSGQKDSAMAHFQAANSLARARTRYDPRSSERLVENIIHQLNEKQVERLQQNGADDPRPIFVLGMPRSGTTLVEQILASHPRVMAGGERHDLDKVIASTRITRNPSVRFPDWISFLDPADTVQLGKAYLDRLPLSVNRAEDRMTDKLPGNYRFLGLIHLMFPQASIIHVRRNPADTCLSCYLHNFSTGHYYSFDQTELGRYYRSYTRLMRHWRDVLPQDAFLEVNYEDIVTDPERTTGVVLDYCGLDWDDACLNFFETDRAIKTASVHQVRKPIYHHAVDRWKEYAPYLGPLFLALGDLAPEICQNSGDRI